MTGSTFWSTRRFRSSRRFWSTRRAAMLVAAVVALGVLADGPTHAGAVQRHQEQESGQCVRLQRRADEIPGIRRRVRGHVAELEARIAAAVDPVRRARLERRLQPRIERLDRLDQRLGAYLAEVDARCGARLT